MGKSLQHAAMSLPRGYLFGLTLSTAGSSTTFTTAAGEAVDDTFVDLMSLGSSLAKTTGSWAVGAAAGSLDTGSIAASTWYHAYVIKRLDTGVVDILTSLSATAPTMPANYTLKRRIGSMRTNGSSQWAQFTQVGDQFYWAGAFLDLNTTVTTSRTLATLTVPANTLATFRAYMFSATVGTNIIIQPTAEIDGAPSTTAAPLLSLYTEVTNQGTAGHFSILADASSQIAVRASGASTTVRITTFGWEDLRGKLS